MNQRTRSPNKQMQNNRKELTIIDCLRDPALLGRFIEKPQTFAAWFAFLRAFFAIDPEHGDLSLYQQCTGRTIWPTKAASEAWLPIGVRGGKSFIISILAVYLAFFKRYPQLKKGETGYVLIVAPTRKQAGIIKNYISGFLQDHPLLKGQLKTETSDEILLSNGIAISTISSDFKSLRGFTAVACIVDEIAYLNVEGSKPDKEVIRALRTRLASTDGPLLAIGSPYAKRGELYEVFRRHHGQDRSEILVWKAPSRTMNPTLSRKVIDRAKLEDPEAAKADYEAEFRSDIETFVNVEVVEAVVIPDRFELSPIPRVEYRAFVDPAGGSGADSMTLAISHTDAGMLVLDAVREVHPPFSPESVVREFAQVLHSYQIRTVTGDRFGGEWPRERFAVYHVHYALSEKNKSDLYRDFLPLLNSGEVQLLDNEVLIKQICALERRTARGGRDIIDHPPGQHDDLANVVAGVLAHPEKTKRCGTWGSELPDGNSRMRGLEVRRAFVPGDKQMPGRFITRYGDDDFEIGFK